MNENIVMPIALFIVDVLIKHKPMHQMDIVSTVFAASIFSLIYAFLASGNNSKKVKENSDVCWNIPKQHFGNNL